MRAFIAIELPKEIKSKIEEFQKELKGSEIFVAKWVNSFHLTLKFLGEVEDIEKIKRILEEICSENKTFEISINSFGAFPSKDYVRVLWLGVKKGDSEAKELNKQIQARLGKDTREYTNHLTIARLKKVLDKHKLKSLFEVNRNRVFGEFQVKSIKLIKSTLTPKGPVYTVLKEFKLLQGNTTQI